MESLGVWPSAALCCALAVMFVLSLYLVDPGQPRDHPSTVRRRMYAILVVCLLAPSALYLLVWLLLGHMSIVSFMVELGVKLNGFPAAVCFPTLLVVVLYAGPIFQAWLEGTPVIGVSHHRWDIVLRNYIIAPFAEELVFRSCMLPVLVPALGQLRAVLICPLFFGIAHVHHLVEWYRKPGAMPFSEACLTVFFQFCYTSIFGLFEGFLFVRTGHLAANVLCHALCNVLGLPPFDRALAHPRKYLILFVYVVGFVMFFVLLFPLTAPSIYHK